jgi:hypothetical protein
VIITSAQLKAARQLLGCFRTMSQARAVSAGRLSSISSMEHGRRNRGLADIRLTLEAAGVKFTLDGPPALKSAR